MLLASLVTLVYLAIRFEWRFGVAAVLSTAHDVLVTLAFIKLLHIEVSLTVVAAILTLLGYSGNDTIIIFDRVRENLKKDRKSPLYDVLNRSINETLPRSVLTHATTLAATLALLFFAGEVTAAVRDRHGVRHLRCHVQLHLRRVAAAALDRAPVAAGPPPTRVATRPRFVRRRTEIPATAARHAQSSTRRCRQPLTSDTRHRRDVRGGVRLYALHR